MAQIEITVGQSWQQIATAGQKFTILPMDADVYFTEAIGQAAADAVGKAFKFDLGNTYKDIPCNDNFFISCGTNGKRVILDVR